MDRRRRVLLDGGEGDVVGPNKIDKPQPESGNQPNTPQRKRSAGYSQEVRRACGQRLVQLIPTRRLSYLAAILLSLSFPAALLTGHYMIYVSGSLPWYGQPLAVALDASHPSSVAAWFSSHLWLLCLGATILTFQLRQHKLDDYDGEYRLWFWLVFTCLAASMDATTHITELLGLALDRWSQVQLGWSGPAVVQATLAVLIGMLGLRMCTELKTVPASLVFWLTGLLAWAGSAILAQEMVKIDISLQLRIWLKVTLWMAGLTSVWLAGLTYLRSVYIEAQRRFMPRGRRLAASRGIPLSQRIRESLPAVPGWRSRESEGNETSTWKLPSFRKRTDAHEEVDSNRSRNRRPARQEATQHGEISNPQGASENQTNEPETQAPRPSSLGFFNRNRKDKREEEIARSKSPAENQVDSEDNSENSANLADSGTKSRFAGWLRKPKDSDEAEEYKKVARNAPRPKTEQAHAETNDASPKTRKPWLPSIRRPKMPAIPRPNLGGLMSKVRLPSFRLPPPSEAGPGKVGRSDASPKSKSVASETTSPTTDSDYLDSDNDGADSARPLSKAERRRLRRQRQNRAA